MNTPKRFVKRKDGQLWRGCEFADLVIGDIFRLFEEETGTPVGNTDWCATSNPELNDQGVLGISAQAVDWDGNPVGIPNKE